MTRGDNSGKTRNTRGLFFHEESIHEVSRRYLEHEYVHTYGQAETNMSPTFSKLGHKKKFGGGDQVRGSGWWGGGVRVDVNAMLGVGGDVGYGGCEPRIEGIVQLVQKGTVQY